VTFLKRRDETMKVVPVLAVSFVETLPDMAGRSVSLDMLSSGACLAVSEFCKRLELLEAL
jgi:hypothetical protein